MMGVGNYQRYLNDYLTAGTTKSPVLLERLARSKDKRVRMRVAENPATPASILEKLIADRNSDVRIAAATNPSTPVHIALKLADDEDINVRLGLALDMNTKPEILNRLVNDPNPHIACGAARTKELVEAKCHRLFVRSDQLRSA